MSLSSETPALPSFSQGFAHFLEEADKTIVPVERDIAIEEEKAAFFRKLRATLLALPTNTEGLNLARLAEFVDHAQLSTKPLSFLDTPEFKDALRIAGPFGKSPHGVYYEALGITVVHRDTRREELNGPEITESIAIHELAHSTHPAVPVGLLRRYQERTDESLVVGFDRPRVHGATTEDLLDRQFGTYFEEGYAELERGLYVEAHGLTEQFTADADIDYNALKNHPVSLRYFNRIDSHKAPGRQQLALGPGAYGASVLDILIKQDERILDNLRESRHNDDGLRKTAESIDRILPGLYDQLQRANSQPLMHTLLTDVAKEFGKS